MGTIQGVTAIVGITRKIENSYLIMPLIMIMLTSVVVPYGITAQPSSSSSSLESSGIEVDGTPLNAAVNPTSNMIYVTTYTVSGNDTVSVIDGSTNKKIQDIEVGIGAVGVDVNPNT